MRGGASALACVVIAGFALVSTAQQPSQAAWEALLAEYEPQLKVAFPTDERYRRNIRVYCTADVTGNGTDEALVTLGYGGAYTGVHTLLRIESGVPTTTRLRRSSGIEYAVELLRGSSAKNVADFELHPNDRAISEIECAMTDNANEPETVACSANSFVWNAQTKLFEY